MEESNADNLLRHHIENYVDFFRIFVNEERADYLRSYPNKSLRLKAIKKGNNTSPHYRFSQAEVLLQWALIELKFGDFFTAIRDIKKAYHLLDENARLFPSFTANKKSLGALHAILSTIPPQYKKGFEWISGMKGSIELGKQEIEEVLKYAEKEDFLFREETEAIYAYLQLHLLNKKEEAWQYINTTNIANQKHPMAIFVLANIAMRSNHNEEAIEILEQRFQHSQGRSFHFLDLMHGIALLNKLDPQASLYLDDFIKNYKGENYVKEAYQKLAWHGLLFGPDKAYDKYMLKCKTEGKMQIDEDKAAFQEAKSKEKPKPLLLKSRLLFDGGYYKKAAKLLIENSKILLADDHTQSEYNYRLGRINQALAHDYLALTYYQTCIRQEQQGRWSCNAALQSGIILEKQGLFEQAEQYFKKCLAIKPTYYASSLHQKAKAGLNRINQQELLVSPSKK